MDRKSEEMTPLKNVKLEYDEESLYIEEGTNFIDVKDEPEPVTVNEIEPEKDPLAEQDVIKQEIHEVPLEGCLTDYVIPEDEDVVGVKEEDEVIIDDRQGFMDWHEDKTLSKTKEWKCKHCGRSFSVRSQMEEHQLKHNSNELFPCHSCAKKFTKSKLTEHLTESHKDIFLCVNQLTCEICHKKCKSLSSLKSHTLFHKVERKLQCTKCKNVIHWVGSLQQFNMFKDGEKPFVCQSCDKITMSKLIEIARKNTKPNADILVLKSKASATITSSNVLNFSLPDRSIQGLPVSCDICYIKFNSYPELLAHRLEHKVEKELHCLSCGIMTNWSGTLGQCNKYVDGEEEFICAKCLVNKGMKCAVCSKVVNCFSGTIRLFTKIVDNVQQHEQQFVCSPCNIMSKVTNTSPDADCDMFITQMFKPIVSKQPELVNLNVPITQSMTTIQQHKNGCILCNATFQSFHKLHSHKEIHKIQSQINCTKCKKVIKWFGSLADLEDLISGMKNIVCTQCSNKSVENKQSPKSYVHANVTCNNCLVSIKWVGTLAQLEKYTSKLEKIICESCQISVRIINRNLVKDKKQYVQTNVICTNCHRMFQWNGTFSLLAVIVSGKSKVICPVCVLKVAEVNNKVKDTPKKDPESDMYKYCKICKRRFIKFGKGCGVCRNKNLKEINCKCSERSSEFICEPCSKKGLVCDLCRPVGKLLFTDITSFLTHIKCHIPIKDFVCRICNQIGYWGNDLDAVNDFKCRRCNTDESLVEFSKLTKENIIFENKIVDHFNTTPMIEKELECCTCKKLYPWCGNEKQLKEFTSGSKTYICLKCYGQIQ